MISPKEHYPPTEGANENITNNLYAPSCGQCGARNLSLCSALDDNQVKEVAEFSRNQIIKADQIICQEDEEANYHYNVQSGCVRVSKTLSDGRRQIIVFLFPGDCFGLSCLNGYSYTAESITEVKLCRMPRDQVLGKLNEIPALPLKILDITRTALRCSIEQILLLGQKNAKEKLCSFLLLMTEKSKQIENNPINHVYLPMCRSDIADYLGLTTETISRQFTILCKDSIISPLDKTSVTIIDKERLKLIASGG